MKYLQQLFGLNGQTVVVTGAGGIGGMIALALAKAGALNVIVTNRTQEKSDETARVLRATLAQEGLTLPATFYGVAFNSADPVSCSTFAKRIEQQLGIDKVHTLVSCAGGNVKEATLSPNPSDGRLCLDDLDPEQIAKTLHQNVMSDVIAVQQLTKFLFRSGKASVICIGSMAALDGGLTRVGAYGAGKAALHTIARWMSVEFAKHEERYGSGSVRVNVLAPGFFETDQNRMLLFKNLDPREYSERGLQIIEATPMGRFGALEELAGAAIFLASPVASGFVNGIILPVDGGFSAYSGV